MGVQLQASNLNLIPVIGYPHDSQVNCAGFSGLLFSMFPTVFKTYGKCYKVFCSKEARSHQKAFLSLKLVTDTFN